jgi:HAD superfamily hydrolase (TIGR01509 family)
MKLKAVIFDMDGLLLNTEPVYRRSWTTAAEKLGYSIPDDFYDSLIGVPNSKGEKILGQYFGTNFPAKDFGISWRSIFKKILTEEGVAEKPGTREILKAVKQLNLKTAIATSSSRKEFEGNPAALKLADHMDAIITCDDVSKPKPDPETYLHASFKLNAQCTESIAIEDSNNGMRSAISAGCRAVMVPDLVDPEADIATSAFKIVNSLFEVIPIITGLQKNI